MFYIRSQAVSLTHPPHAHLLVCIGCRPEHQYLHSLISIKMHVALMTQHHLGLVQRQRRLGFASVVLLHAERVYFLHAGELATAPDPAAGGQLRSAVAGVPRTGSFQRLRRHMTPDRGNNSGRVRALHVKSVKSVHHVIVSERRRACARRLLMASIGCSKLYSASPSRHCNANGTQ